MSFKPKFTGKSVAAAPQAGAKQWKDRPYKILKFKAEGDERATFMAFMSLVEGKFGEYFSGAEVVLDDDGNPAKDAEGKIKKTETKYFFDPKNLELRAQIGNDKTIICTLKPSKFGEGSFFGVNEDKVSFYLDSPKKK